MCRQKQVELIVVFLNDTNFPLLRKALKGRSVLAMGDPDISGSSGVMQDLFPSGKLLAQKLPFDYAQASPGNYPDQSEFDFKYVYDSGKPDLFL